VKIVFTTSGDNLDAPVDRRFGRAPKFLIYDLDNDTFEVIDNQQNLNAAQGAGIQSAQTVAETGAQALITGHSGPNVYRVLSAAGVTIYNAPDGTIAEILEQYRAGKLEKAGSADVEGHWI